MAPPVDGAIDVNTHIGPAHGRAGGPSIDDLVAEQRSHDVGLSLVRHRSAVLSDVDAGNHSAIEVAAGHPSVLPIAVLGVDRSDVVASVVALGSNVAGFWIEGRAVVASDSAAVDELLRAVASTGKPLFAAIRQFGDASRIGAATAGLGMPVILVGLHYDNAGDTLAAARRYDHLHLETSRMAHLGAIEGAVRLVGAERLLFGTGSPTRSIQSVLNAVALARIPDDAKRAILAGNAARLFGLEVGTVPLPVVDRPTRTFDVHTHSGRTAQDTPVHDDERLLAELERQTNTRRSVASSILAIESDSERGNRELVESCRRLPARLGYLYADPDDLPETRSQFRRWIDAPGIVGAKVSCETSERHTSSRQIADLFDLLAGFGKPVKIHNDGPDWDVALRQIAERHPRLPIIVAHAGLGTPDVRSAKLATDLDNVYLELSSSFAELPTIREVVRLTPPGKLLFGTDAPLLDPGFGLGMYQDAGIPADRQDEVYYADAARLFGSG
jgi:predicted TIM-barrel fold metal-dependent hydrolase